MSATLSQLDSMVKMFPNPYRDDSDPSFWEEEIVVLKRLLKGDDLHTSRHYIAESQNYAVSTWWGTQGPPYEEQWDGPIWRLLGRQMIRPETCGGGMVWIVLTPEARHALEGKL